MAAFLSSPPSYWTHRRAEVGHRYFLEDVPGRIKSRVIEIIKSNWNFNLVGAGRDATKLKHLGIKFVGVKRVENPELFHSYDERRRDIVLRRGHCPPITDISEPLASFERQERLTTVNEYYLFHGTGQDAATNIANIGFQIREADPDGMFGQGIYFSDSFMKADQYADDPDNRRPPGTELTVIMARVVLGQTYTCDRADADRLNRPPCIQHGESCECGPQKRYDSIKSRMDEFLFTEFAVFNGMQSYPEYIITYTRRGKQPRSSSKDKEKTKRPTNKPKKDKPKKDKPKRDKPKPKKEPLTWQQAVRSVADTLDGKAEVNGIMRLHTVYQKARTALPVYTFRENRYSQDNKWECECTIHFPIMNTIVGIERRRKLAKRSAAEQMWEFLKSLLETNPLLHVENPE